MKLEEIGFYTLSDERAMHASHRSPLWRCELIITDKCNFSCPYCRGLRDDCKGVMPIEYAKKVIARWRHDRLKNIRFSGGEPTLHSGLLELVKYSKKNGVKRIAISTNGSANLKLYNELIEAGVNDLSISLDACCAATNEIMSGKKEIWEHVLNNIKELSKKTYVTVGVVLTEQNENEMFEIIDLASLDLNVSDIRIIPAAQYKSNLTNNDRLKAYQNSTKHPILRYRLNNLIAKKSVRSLAKTDFHYCPLVLDDMAVAGIYHFPCIIYLREQGNPIGIVSRMQKVRMDRKEWFLNHNCYEDPICRNNCLDVCVDYNNKWSIFNKWSWFKQLSFNKLKLNKL